MSGIAVPACDDSLAAHGLRVLDLDSLVHHQHLPDDHLVHQHVIEHLHHVPHHARARPRPFRAQSARCALDAAIHGDECRASTLPAKLTKKVGRAVRLIEEAERSGRRKAKRLLRQAAGTDLRVAGRLAKRAAGGKKPKLSTGRAVAIRSATDGVRAGLGA